MLHRSNHRARGYVGRFAPSPSGPLHDGSLVAAMASYLDARAHRGQWLVRIEDIDTPRIAQGADRLILQQLQAFGMQWDAQPVWQSQRHGIYQSAFDALRAQALVYGCACTRQEISMALARQARNPDHKAIDGLAAAPQEGAMASERPYPGTCRQGIPQGRLVRAWRFIVPPRQEHFNDRWLGPQRQDLQREVGDFILKRADGLWAYQLVVVVDDGAQGITHIVRGADLLSSTARQRVLARSLSLDSPSVMHVPLVLDEHGHKLSKQNHATALDCTDAVKTLNLAWQRLGFKPLPVADTGNFWRAAVPQWAARFNIDVS